MQIITIMLLMSLIIVLPKFANAYIGPGLGAGTIGVILGVVGSVFIAIFAIVWYPLKRLLKKNKKSKHQGSSKQDK